MQTVLSGIRATGKLHFGSMMGAVQNFVKFQSDTDTTCLYFIADYHTLTTLQNPDELKTNLVEMVKDYIAAGLDPEQSIIYAQSSVPEIAELSLFLGMLQPFGDLERTPSFKDMARRYPDNINHGTFSYPVLMAADILGPQSTLVPVGEDQRPNVEMARELARRFNTRYDQDVFTIPDMLEQMVRVPGLDGGKMGKSDAQNAIGIDLSLEEIRNKYRRGITDTNRVRLNIPGNPDNCASVYPIHRLVTSSETPDLHPAQGEIADMCRTASLGCSDCKNKLAENIYAILEPFQERRRDLDDQDDYIRYVLHEGGKRARSMIQPTVEQVAECMGIVRY